MILGIDVSHHQGSIDFRAVKGAGRDFAILKATEGVGYVDPNFAAYRAQAHAAGLVVGLYHFARAGDPAAEAAHFLATIGTLAAGEFLVLDWEVPAADPPAWCDAWLDAVRGATGVRPLLYLNQSARDGHDWSRVIADDEGLWLAKYDGSTDPVPAGAWPALALKQYSDKGMVPGVAGGVDLNVFYGDAAALLRYGQPATPAPVTPPPAPAFDVRAWRVSAGQSDAHLPGLRRWANRMYPGYRSTPLDAGPTTNYGPQTTAFVAEFGAHVGVPNDGRDIGPRIAAALYAQGFRG